MAVIKKVAIPEGTSSSVKSIISGRKSEKGKVKASVPTVETLEDLYGNSLPNPTMTIDDYVRGLHNQAKSNVEVANAIICARGEQAIENPTDSAFNNCNGRWTELGYAVYVWNALAKLNKQSKEDANGEIHTVYVYVKLPNRTSPEKDWTQLLRHEITSWLADYPGSQSAKVPENSNNRNRYFELISSNPDAVILKYHSVDAKDIMSSANITQLDLYSEISSIDFSAVSALDSLFSVFSGRVLPSTNLQCFLSIKRSTRPDRRYQWVHEGDRVKTLLQLIQIASSLPGNSQLDRALKYEDLNGKFFAVSLSKVSDADTEAMNAGLAGCIISPSLSPVWAVDHLFECIKFEDIISQINEMIAFK